MLNIFPIRHHSPAASLLVAEYIRQIQPKLILIEGPSDANHIIDILTDAETQPPVAILAYRQPDSKETTEAQYIMYPFASYSPEYVALQQAKALKIPARFVDIPAAISMQFYRNYEQVIGYQEMFDELVARSGYRSFEEFWEAAFENGGMNVHGFIETMLDYARLLREKNEANPTDDFKKDLFREQFMRQEIAKAIHEGYQPDKMLIVCGAFHAAAIARTKPTPSPSQGGNRVEMPETQSAPAEITVIPYSYPRLSEQLGYGAGNRAPLYYEHVYRHQGDFGAASLETMVACMNYLHFKGHSVSLADVIEANRLAKILANLREKRAPGLEEISEALTACLMHGSKEVVQQFLWDFVVGRAVGRVSSKIGKTALQQEFYREINQRKLPLTDSPQEFILHLHNPTEIGSSIFLHRLRLSDIPFAQSKETVSSAYDYLASVREKWQVQWTPAVDAALVEKSLLGNALVEVCRRALTDRLSTAENAQTAAETLLEIVIGDVKDLFQKALVACDFLASEDNDFFSLARACQNLQALISYGSSRELKPADVEPMLTRTFNRAVLLLSTAAKVSDDAVEQVCTGVTILSDLASRAPQVDKELFAAAVRDLIGSYAAHPKVAGLAAAIAHFSKLLDEMTLLHHLNQRLSGGNQALNAAWFLDGFLSLNKLVLVRSLPVVKILDSFVQAIRPEDFVTALPMLRRAFADLSHSELNYFLEHLSGIHQIVETKVVQQVIEASPEQLKDLDQAAQALDDLF